MLKIKKINFNENINKANIILEWSIHNHSQISGSFYYCSIYKIILFKDIYFNVF